MEKEKETGFTLGCKVVWHCLQGQGAFVTRLIAGIISVTAWVIGDVNLLTMSPWPSM